MEDQFVVTIQVDGRMDVVGPFRSYERAETYAEMRRGGDRTFVQTRPLYRLSPETRRELATS